jgi:hypothetical protein
MLFGPGKVSCFPRFQNWNLGHPYSCCAINFRGRSFVSLRTTTTEGFVSSMRKLLRPKAARTCRDALYECADTTLSSATSAETGISRGHSNVKRVPSPNLD